MANDGNKDLIVLRGEIKTPPMSRKARSEAGFLLRKLQQGDSISMPHSRPMPSIGAHCHELRIVDENSTWRIVYRIDADAVLILEVFSKRPEKHRKISLILAKGEFQITIQSRTYGDKKMNEEKRKILEAKGWKVTSVADFLELTPEENALIELRLALSNALKQKRLEAKMTQEEFAKRLRSSQSRLAKMEAGDPSVSFDLLIKNLFAIGIDKEKLGEIIAASV